MSIIYSKNIVKMIEQSETITKSLFFPSNLFIFLIYLISQIEAF